MHERVPSPQLIPVKDFYNAGNPKDIQDHCAVAGIIGPDIDYAGRYAYTMAASLQHRGQESAGVVLGRNGSSTLLSHKGMGLVDDVHDHGNALNGIDAYSSLIQNRYGTFSVGSSENHIQPVHDEELSFTLAHNGNIPDTAKLDSFLDQKGVSYGHMNDTERMHAVMAYYIRNGASLEDAMARLLPVAEGAASLLAMDKDKIVAARDGNGIRPLAMGKLGENVVFASETVGLDAIGAEYLREVRPGEMIIADRTGIGGIRSYQAVENVEIEKESSPGETEIVPVREKLDLFELIYFARPESYLLGKPVRKVRESFGAHLYGEFPKIDADIVITAPDSATPAAKGFAKAAGIPFDEQAVRKNPDAKRTFINPDPTERMKWIEKKFILDRERIKGKRAILVEDSTVRSSTGRVLNRLLWEAGVAEIHFANTSPPIRFPELHGMDIPVQEPLAAYARSVEQVRQIMDATSLTYLSMDGVIKAINAVMTDKQRTVKDFSTGPFTGEYPTKIGNTKAIDRTFYDFYLPLHAHKGK